MLNNLCEPAGDDIEVVIDVSNVCRDERLLPQGHAASWDRLRAILEAWNTWQPHFERPRVRMVADSSLRHLLNPADRHELDAAIQTRLAIETDYADPTILDLVEQHESLVVTRDEFVGHREERRWIDGKGGTFVQWDADPVGRPLLRLAVLRRRSHLEVSRRSEADDLKAQRIDEDKGRGTHLLTHVYRCDNPTCVRRALALDQSNVPPVNVAGTATCLGCGRPLTVVGPRSSTAIIRIGDCAGTVVRRFALAEGEQVDLGRLTTVPDLAAVVRADDLTRISRRHVRLRFDGCRLHVTDLGSANGTIVTRWNAQDAATEERLMRDATTILRRRDVLRLAKVLEIRWSGRRYPFDIDSARSGAAADAAGLPMTAIPTTGGH